MIFFFLYLAEKAFNLIKSITKKFKKGGKKNKLIYSLKSFQKNLISIFQ